MYCDRCGAELQDAQNFCPMCGKPTKPTSLGSAQGRVAGHARLVGILWIALSAIRLIPGVVLLFLFQPGSFALPPEVPGFVQGLLQFIGVCFLAAAAVGVATGWGLLKRRSWARMLAIVFACFNLLELPIGTALGIYTLWVLLPAKSEEEYRQLATTA